MMERVIMGIIPGQGTFCVDFACSPCVCVGFHWEFWFPPTVQRWTGLNRCTGDANVSLDVSVCERFVHVPALSKAGELQCL